MIYKYLYSITGHASVNTISKLDGFNNDVFKEGIYSIDSDILNEHFYYGLVDVNNNLCPTYYTNLEIHTMSNSYEINYKILSNSPDMIDELCKIYKPDDFNLNNIIELSGGDLEETYEIMKLKPFDITDIVMSVELLQFCEDFDDDYDVPDLANFIFICHKQII